MAFSDLSPEEMRRALIELDQALFHHEQWQEELNRTLICGLAPDRREIEKHAHRECRFGQWLYREGVRYLAGHPAFAVIESLHHRLHDYARDLLVNTTRHQPVPLEDYERFVNVLKQLRLEVLTTKHEIEDNINKLNVLTGVSSRADMLTRLQEQQALVDRKLESCCLAMMALDHYKTIEDTYGHAIGDRVLTTLGLQLRRYLRRYDLFFRYGGVEFLICLPKADIETGYNVIDRLRQSLAKVSFESPAGSFHVTVSFGVAVLVAGVSVETSIRRADEALCAARAGGEDQVNVWSASIAA